MNTSSLRGFTLIEIIITLAILALVVTLLVGGLNSFRGRSELKVGTSTVETVLQLARQKTLSSEHLSTYGVYIEGERLTLFSGTVYDANDSSNVVYDIGDTLTLEASLQGGGSTLVFERLTGETTNYGTIVITSDQGATATIVVEQTGLIYEE